MSHNDVLGNKRAAIIAELQKSPLIVHELTALNSQLLTARVEHANVHFGTGLIASKRLTRGLPLDFLGYLLTAERVRRACGLAGIVHLVADNHAKHEAPEHADEIAALAENIRAMCKKVAAKVGLAEKYKILLASEVHHAPAFNALYAETACVEDMGIPKQAVNYLRSQLTDMEYFRQHHDVVLKLSWVLDRKVLHSSGGFDERFFDNAYTKVFGDGLSYVYTLSGRTFDSTKPRSAPYVATDPDTRLMLWPVEDVGAKLNRFIQATGRTTNAVLDHLRSLTDEFEALVGPIPADDLIGKIIALAQVDGGEAIQGNNAHAILRTLAETVTHTPIKTTTEGNATMSTSFEATSEQLHHGVNILTPPDGLMQKLEKARTDNRPLIVKLGMDPTAPDLHLGHAVVLRKMRQFQDAGHKLIVIIGDFTARIGDPTGRNKARPPLSQDVISQNARTYLDQLSKVLDMDESKLQVRYNSEWLGKMNFADVIRLQSKVTLAQLLQRDDFRNRYEKSIPIAMHEMLYPLMQGHDSVVLNADIEMGGTDQLFNCLIGRVLQEQDDKPGQVVVSMPLLVGLDGTEKMSKSANNYIGLTEEPNQMYGKAMSIPDELLPNYLDLTTDFPLEKIVDLKARLADGSLHPMEAKKMIAENIVKQYHDEAAATEATAYFYRQFQQKNGADKAYKPVDIATVFAETSAISLVDLCAKLQPEMSRSEARRLITANAVSVNEEKIADPLQMIQRPDEGTLNVRIGRRGFFTLVPSD